jgi:hypothetical protein
MDENNTPTPAIPERVRTVAYALGTLVLVFATSVGDAIPDPWGRIATGFGAACVALAFGYRPTR